ncbi:sugar ABC transporter ATP-binding protein [Blautia sp. MSJ-9]|uniref:sugar ABC transporter ATP-binding protein n=1 Tax=Blautia sp. MSJ-9 TaxID=2841511 RepID=UPI001C0F4DA0|nr:sugar ABC transporter ATP-binding protein [Blautia sp. MSJ-9]MBU5680639.1 sugar ABC transporter ATP-binding protein [Blautia sp. MSJ-9]
MNEVIVSMNNISKTFPGVKALDNVHFELRSGEVMALLGENGAGKSTLMKILSGVYTRDGGTMEIFGKSYDDLTPKQAQEAGVAIIHQELNMCKHLSVAENMFLGREMVGKGILDNRKMRQEARNILNELKIDIDPDQTVGDLPVSKQQMVEIAKALSIHAKILIMDEPTSALTAREIEDLFRIIKDLKAQGCGIVYISHRLEELAEIVDRVTIMRDGQYITDGNFKDMTMDQIITNMVGREIKEKFPRVTCTKGKKVFEVKNLNAGRMVRDINFSLYEGEIVGFAGLMGAGRTETTRAIFGVDAKESGEFYLDGQKIEIHNPMDAIKNGVVLAPEDRKKDGLCTKLSIRQNLALPNLDIICNKLGVIRKQKEDGLCAEAVRNLRIKTPNVEIDSGNLSGGNQQKVVVGKWLARNSRVVIFDEPTRGIDVGAKVEIYNLMNDLKKQGIAVIFAKNQNTLTEEVLEDTYHIYLKPGFI